MRATVSVLCLSLIVVMPAHAAKHKGPPERQYHRLKYASSSYCPPAYHLCDGFCFPVGLPLACFWPKPETGPAQSTDNQ